VKKENKYLVLKLEDIEEGLWEPAKETFWNYINMINVQRRKKGKKDNSYIVVNEDEPYAQKVWDLILGKQESDPYGLGFQNTEAHR